MGWQPNLVKVMPYDFFVGIGDINSSFLPKQVHLPSQASDCSSHRQHLLPRYPAKNPNISTIRKTLQSPAAMIMPSTEIRRLRHPHHRLPRRHHTSRRPRPHRRPNKRTKRRSRSSTGKTPSSPSASQSRCQKSKNSKRSL